MEKLSREEFVEQVIRLAAAKFPLVEIQREDERFSLKINGHSASLENLYRMTLLRPQEIQHHVDRWIVELLRAAEGTPDDEADFEEIASRIMPMILSSSGPKPSAESMVSQPLVEGLVVAYAVDHDRTISYIPQRLFESWKVDLDELHKIAIANLSSRSESMAAHAAQDEAGKINLILFQNMDGYDASRILLPTLHNRLREHLGSPFIAAIPNRDILLCFRNDTDNVPRLRQQIAADFQQMPYQVTDKLFLVTPDGIAPLSYESE